MPLFLSTEMGRDRICVIHEHSLNCQKNRMVHPWGMFAVTCCTGCTPIPCWKPFGTWGDQTFVWILLFLSSMFLPLHIKYSWNYSLRNSGMCPWQFLFHHISSFHRSGILPIFSIQQTCLLSADMLQHSIWAKNERKGAHSEPWGNILKINNAYPWPDMWSHLVRNNIKDSSFWRYWRITKLW